VFNIFKVSVEIIMSKKLIAFGIFLIWITVQLS